MLLPKAWSYNGNNGTGKEHLPRVSGYGKISFNVGNKCFSELCHCLKIIFDLSLENGIFPDLKIARIIPVVKIDHRSKLEKFRPILLLR